MGSFQTALSSLKAAATAIDTVGNNLANINTTGFKRSSSTFADVMNSVGSSPEHQVGSGVGIPSNNRVFGQGTITSTGDALDAAIQGSGFFVIRPENAASSAFEYTRDGHFRVSSTGLLVTATGARVQGWNLDPATGKVDTSTTPTDISVPVGSIIPATPTSSMNISANLDATTAPNGSFSVPLQFFDALGGAHEFTLTLTKDATTANKWNLDLTTTDSTVDTTSPLKGLLDTKSISFVNGLLDPATPLSIKIDSIPFKTTSGIPDLPAITWNLWKTPPTGVPPAGGQSGLTQFSQASAVSILNQNGTSAGTLADIRVGDGGSVMASYTNGAQVQIARLGLSTVQNPDTLLDVGGNAYRPSAETSALPPTEAGTGGSGQIVGEALESSNVDIAQEFTELITFQRSYQASSRVITTVDQLTQEVLNLKQ
jgi:flagellar hook protein FlgE